MSEDVERVARAGNPAGVSCVYHDHLDAYDTCESCRLICNEVAEAAIAAITPAPDVGVIAEVRAFAQGHLLTDIEKALGVPEWRKHEALNASCLLALLNPKAGR